MSDQLTNEEILAKLDQEGAYLSEINQKQHFSQSRWTLNVFLLEGQAVYPGAGPTFRDALVQAAGAEEGGVEGASSIHVAFTTFEQAFRASWRVDG